MHKVFKLILLCTLLQGCIGAGPHSPFQSRKPGYLPSLTGLNLHGQLQQFPKSFSQPYQLLVFAFQRQQQAQVNRWLPTFEQLNRQFPQLGFYEIPLLYEMSFSQRWWLNNSMRLGIQNRKARQQTVTVYTNRAKFLKHMAMDKQFIYVLLVNRQGKILWQTRGEPKANTATKIASFISKS